MQRELILNTNKQKDSLNYKEMELRMVIDQSMVSTKTIRPTSGLEIEANGAEWYSVKINL